MSKIAKTSLKNAYERHLETQRDDALFQDPLAEYMIGQSGKPFSIRFGQASRFLGFQNWPEFGITFTAVGTVMIDKWLKEGFGKLGGAQESAQIVNLGSGMDSRGYRLDFLPPECEMYEVDLPSVNLAKRKFLQSVDPKPKCYIKSVDCDLLTNQLEKALLEHGFEPSKPTFWIAEGLLPYMRPTKHQLDLLNVITKLSGKGSEACFHFKLDQSSFGLKPDTINEIFASWHSVKYIKFGDPELDYGRYKGKRPNDKFSYAICTRDDILALERQPSVTEDPEPSNPCKCEIS